MTETYWPIFTTDLAIRKGAIIRFGGADRPPHLRDTAHPTVRSGFALTIALHAAARIPDEVVERLNLSVGQIVDFRQIGLRIEIED